jgi:hypothetical protein
MAKDKKGEIVWVSAIYKDKYISGYGTIEDAIKQLQNLQVQALGEGWKDLVLDYRSLDSYSDTERLYIVGKRPENEKEKTKRLDRIKATQDWERKQYEALKTKFEGK